MEDKKLFANGGPLIPCSPSCIHYGGSLTEPILTVQQNFFSLTSNKVASYPRYAPFTIFTSLPVNSGIIHTSLVVRHNFKLEIKLYFDFAYYNYYLITDCCLTPLDTSHDKHVIRIYQKSYVDVQKVQIVVNILCGAAGLGRILLKVLVFEYEYFSFP